jgi:hypothetical protein
MQASSDSFAYDIFLVQIGVVHVIILKGLHPTI